MIQVTNVQLSRVVNHPRVCAYVSVVLADCFIVRGLRIIQSQAGKLILAMPNRKDESGSYHDICHPVDPSFRAYLEDRVFRAYRERDGVDWSPRSTIRSTHRTEPWGKPPS